MKGCRASLLAILLLPMTAWCENLSDGALLPSDLTGNPVSAEELAEQRGREGFVFELDANYNDQAARVSDNRIWSGRTGYNRISGQAFNDAAGNITVIQNSGNGVAIQSSTQINLSIEF